MTPKEYAVEAATIYNAGNPGHFSGRPLFEGLVENAVKKALQQQLPGGEVVNPFPGTITNAVKTLDEAAREMDAAQQSWLAAKQSVIDAAKSAGVTTRIVIVIGHTAWYIDPPGSGHGNGNEWWVTFGSPPEVLS